MTAITLGIGARGLRDTDYFSKSDPFVVISKPTVSGGFEKIRMSETKQNTLNPDWKDFYFKMDEICNGDPTMNIKFEVYDDDGKRGLDGKDKLLGQGFWSLKTLESAYNVHSKLPLMDGKNKHKGGGMVVRTFKFHNLPSNQQSGQQSQVSGYASPHSVGYPPSAAGGGYPSNTTSGYPQPGAPPSGYPGAGAPGGYPSGYPQTASSGYPPSGQSGYPSASASSGYPSSSSGGYPNTSSGRNISSMRPLVQKTSSGYQLNIPDNIGKSLEGVPGMVSGMKSGGYPSSGSSGYNSGYPSSNSGYPSNPSSGYPPSGYPSGGSGGYPSKDVGGYPSGGPGYGSDIGAGGLFPDSRLPPGPGYRR